MMADSGGLQWRVKKLLLAIVVLVLLAVAISTLLWSDLSVAYVWIAVVTTLLYGVIGFADDYLKVKRRHNLGLTGRQKLLLQFIVAFAFGLALKYLTTYSTRLSVPFFKTFNPELWWPIYLLAFSPLGWCERGRKSNRHIAQASSRPSGR